MSMLRKVVVSAAIAGAGLGSLAGVASASESAPAQGCSNAVKASSENGAGRTLGDTTGGEQAFDLSNTCDILNGNKILSDNNVATLAGTIVNGDTRTETSSETTETSIAAPITGLLPL